MTNQEQDNLLKLASQTDMKMIPIDIDGEPGVSYMKMRTTNYRRAHVDLVVFWANTVQPAVVPVGVRP